MCLNPLSCIKTDFFYPLTSNLCLCAGGPELANTLPPRDPPTFLFLSDFGLLQLPRYGRFQTPQTAVTHLFAVNEDGRDTADAQPDALFIIPSNLSADFRIFLIRFEFGFIQLQLFGNFIDLLVIQPIVVFIQLVVKFPEFSLPMGSQCSNGGFKGIFVAVNGKIFMYQSYSGWIFLEQLLKLRRKPRTVSSLKFTEHGDGDRRVFGSLKHGSACFYSADKIQQDDFDSFIPAAGRK